MRSAMMMMNVCIFFMVLSPPVANGQWVLTETVAGRVIADGFPVTGAHVQLRNFGHIVQEDFPPDGRFHFWNVAPGVYAVVAGAPGYETVSTSIHVPEELEVLISLRRVTSMNPGGPVSSSVLQYQIPRLARHEFEIARKKVHGNDCKAAIEHLNKAISKLQKGDLAERSFLQTIALTTSVYPALNLADVYIRQQRLQEAAELMTNAIRKNPSQVTAISGSPESDLRRINSTKPSIWL